MTVEAESAANEWRSGWSLVLGAAIGVTLLNVGFMSAGTFVAPLEQAFGWSRAEISSGTIVVALTGVFVGPLVGLVVDKWGARRVVLPGAVLYGLILALFGTLDGSLIRYLALWLALAGASQLIMHTVWATAVSTHFSAGRRLAISFTMMGSGITTIIAPVMANFLIEQHGWRMAYVIMGLGWSGFVVTVGYFLFHDHHSRRRKERTDDIAPPAELTGYTVRDGLRSAAFIKILSTVFICNLLNIALVFHLVPLLSWSGLTRSAAVFVASSLGFSMLAGNMLFGLIGERIPARLFAAIAVAAPAISCVMLLQPDGSTAERTIAVCIFGLCAGSQMPAFTYLASRYFGLRSFATLRAFLLSGTTVAAAIAPVVAGLIFDGTGSYALLLKAGIPLVLVSGLVIQSLGAYPDFKPSRA